MVKFRKHIVAFCIFAATVFPLPAQVGGDIAGRAAELRRAYDFEAAAALYEQLLAGTRDSIETLRFTQALMECENGMNMVQYAARPTVVKVAEVDAPEYHLWFSHLADGVWREMPNPFVGASARDFARATYFEEGMTHLVFSAPGESGQWDLFDTFLQEDGTWSPPQAIEVCNSGGNEIMPVLGKGGEVLFFASDGLAGMGGYDLYTSRWDPRRQRWSAPLNLGFPYSSPYNDLLWSDTPDGNYSLLASDRDAPDGKVRIYVCKYVKSPIKTPVSSPEEARRLASLTVSEGDTGRRGAGVSPDGGETGGNPLPQGVAGQIAAYRAALARARALTDSLSGAGGLLGVSAADEKGLGAMYARLAGISEEVVRLESAILASGVGYEVLKPASGVVSGGASPDSDMAAEGVPEYIFSRRNMGKMPQFTVEQPEPEDPYDYTFFPSGGSVFVTDGTFPQGLVYQIQLSVAAKKASQKQFKGISPIFERRQLSGKYLYTAGVFRSYAEAEAALSKVKKGGFSTAFIIAFRDGKGIPVKQARSEE